MADVAKRQLQGNTEIVEAVRLELAQRDWAVREWATLRRKIEPLVEKMNECRAYLERHQRAAYDGDPLPAGDPIIAFNTISQLYFPQLKHETEEFSKMHRGLVFEGEKLQIKVAQASDKAEASRHRSEYSGRAARITVRDEAALIEAARNILEKIMGVQARSEGAGPQGDAGTSGTK